MDITSKTVKELLKIPHIANVKHFHFSHVSEEFDIETFYDYIKVSNIFLFLIKLETFFLGLTIYHQVSHEGREGKKIAIFVSRDIWTAPYRSPYIAFSGQDKNEVVYKIYHRSLNLHKIT
jgi:hypothetical protein